jgi:hypothetical protein
MSTQFNTETLGADFICVFLEGESINRRIFLYFIYVLRDTSKFNLSGKAMVT